jgi:hypothetical protein
MDLRIQQWIEVWPLFLRHVVCSSTLKRSFAIAYDQSQARRVIQPIRMMAAALLVPMNSVQKTSGQTY